MSRAKAVWERFSRKRQVNALILTGIIALLPCLDWQTLGIGSVRIRSITIFKAWMALVPLCFVVWILVEATKSIRESRAEKSYAATIYYFFMYGCMLLFAASLEWSFVSMLLLGKEPG